MEEVGIAEKKAAVKKAVEVTRPLMEKLAEARYEALGHDVVHASKRAIIDGLGCTIAGAIRPVGASRTASSSTDARVRRSPRRRSKGTNSSWVSS